MMKRIDPSDLLSRAFMVLHKNIMNFQGYRMIVPHPSRYPLPYCWDTAFHVIALVYVDPLLAKENIEGLLSLADSNGMIPNAPTERGDQDLRSQPPVIIYAAEHYYEVTKDIDSIRRWYPALRRYYNWWNERGDVLGSIRGLVSPFTGTRIHGHPMTAYWAICSTGMDNHPVYDFTNGYVIERDKFYYLPVEDLLLNPILASGANALSLLASRLNLEGEREYFEEEYKKKAELINTYLWDEEEGIYYPVNWDGDKIRVKTIQAFSTLFAKVADKERAERIVEHLKSSEEFWGEFGVPSIAFNDEKYMTPQPTWMYSRDPYYWRGPIWAPTLYLTFKGLLNYGYERLAEELAFKWIKLLSNTGIFAEYYFTDGRPGATNLSDFSWTAAVTISMLVELRFISRKRVQRLYSISLEKIKKR